MKKTLQILLIGLITTMPFMQARPAAALEDAIIAIVNDELITLRDLKDYIRQAYVGLIAEGYPDDQIKQIMLDMEINGLDKLIEDKLILSAAKDMGLTINESVVEEKVKELRGRYVSDEEFMKALEIHGVTITDIRNKIKDQLRLKFIVEDQVRSKIYVNPQEVTQYYEEHKDEFKKKEHVFLDSIFIPFTDPGSIDSVMKEAKTASELLKTGKSFSAVAEEYSSSPSIGKVERGQLQPEIENTVFSLKEGGVTNPIPVQNGVYVFVLREKTSGEIASLIDVKNTIQNKIFNEKFRKRFRKWIDDLKDDAYIEIKK